MSLFSDINTRDVGRTGEKVENHDVFSSYIVGDFVTSSVSIRVKLKKGTSERVFVLCNRHVSFVANQKRGQWLFVAKINKLKDKSLVGRRSLGTRRGLCEWCGSMASVTLANRELKNKATGIDIYVPRYEDIQGPLGGSVLYDIIVVTRLFYFKTSGKHKESDVVQFMVPQKYNIFEELYHKLDQKFASVVFPPLPKKALLVSDAVVSERRRFMETVLQQIAKTPKLACSSLVLEFLGATRATQKELDPLEKNSATDKEGEDKEEESVEDVDLFAAAEDEKPQQEDEEETEEDLQSHNTNSKIPMAAGKGSSLFGIDDDERDDDIDDLFIPKGAVEKKKVNIEVEDNSELLTIEDDLDELLKVRKPKKPEKPQKPQKPPKPKPQLKPKPKPELKPKPSPKSTFDETAVEDDIFKTTPSKPKAEKANVSKTKGQDEDLFAQARKQSFRKPSHEEDTLDDIFKSSPKPAFSSADADEDLFKQRAPDKLTADDISNYIQQNTQDSEASLDLF